MFGIDCNKIIACFCKGSWMPLSSTQWITRKDTHGVIQVTLFRCKRRLHILFQLWTLRSNFFSIFIFGIDCNNMILFQLWTLRSNLFLLSAAWHFHPVGGEHQILQMLHHSLPHSLLHSQILWSEIPSPNQWSQSGSWLPEIRVLGLTSRKSFSQVIKS